MSVWRLLVIVYVSGVVFFAGWFVGGIVEFEQEWSWADVATVILWPLLIPMTFLRP